MVRVLFTPNLRRHCECEPREVPAGTVREVLEAAFRDNPRLRGYVLDEHGWLREHVVLYVANSPVLDRKVLGDLVPDGGELFVFQALSGG